MHIPYCPIGFAHGFYVLPDVTDVISQQSNYYSDKTERGIAYNDPDVAIAWPLPVGAPAHSERAGSAVNVGDRRWSATIFSAPCSWARGTIRWTKLPPLEALPCRP